MIRDFLLGYLEAELSWGVYVNLLTTTKKYCVLKPVVLLQAADSAQLDFLKKQLGLAKDIREENKGVTASRRRINALRLQQLADIDKVIALIGSYEFLTPKRQRSWLAFLKAYEFIKTIGQYHTDYSPALKIYLQDYHPLRRNAQGLSTGEWVAKVQRFFVDDDATPTDTA
jgi:hypothetical protein